MVNRLPSDYYPFTELEICSNHFINGKVPIEVAKHIVLLVGKGQQPMIWLSGSMSREGKRFQEVVEKNESLNKAVDVVISAEENSTSVRVGDIIMVQATKASEEKAIVSKLDLRPVGFNVYGDTTELWIGTNRLVSNTFRNVHTMVGIGE